MRDTLKSAELLEERVSRLDPASYMTPGYRNTFELMVRAHRKSLISSPSFAPWSATLWAYLRLRTSITPAQANGKQPPAISVRCS